METYGQIVADKNGQLFFLIYIKIKKNYFIMSGGILQLVAYGAQDLYITGQPQITFFKTVYRRHTMFSMESIQQTFNGSVGFANRVTSTISRNGDLLHKLWVVATFAKTATEAAASPLGHRLLKTVELEIGGQRIDKHYADWL